MTSPRLPQALSYTAVLSEHMDEGCCLFSLLLRLHNHPSPTSQKKGTLPTCPKSSHSALA